MVAKIAKAYVLYELAYVDAKLKKERGDADVALPRDSLLGRRQVTAQLYYLAVRVVELRHKLADGLAQERKFAAVLASHL